MLTKKQKYTKYACYAGSASQAAVICLSPILFVTFHETYGISYTLLGLLAVVNFCSQLAVDLIFSFFSKHFNIEKTVKYTPLITVLGILLYAVLPILFPAHTYAGIVVGTVVFSVASGLCEVLLSPTIAALHKENGDREMSRFHSVYAWGVVSVVVVSSLFLKLFGMDKWKLLAIFWALLPLTSFVLFQCGEMPDMQAGMTADKEKDGKKILGSVLLFVVCIFFGSAAENGITQWCSGYIETVLGYDKLTGDILGMAMFSVMLGIARTVYGKYGKNIYPVMLVSFIGAGVCYLVAGFSNIPAVGLIACVICGLFVSMLWPGTIIWTENRIPQCGVVVYALLAAGGDFGASVSPQLIGTVTDTVAATYIAKKISQSMGITTEQVGLKAAMILASLFSLCGVITVLVIRKKSRKPAFDSSGDKVNVKNH